MCKGNRRAESTCLGVEDCFMEPMKVVPLNISAPPPGLERYGGYSTPPSAESSPPGLRLPREVRQEATSFRAPPGLEGEQVLAPTLLARRRPAMPPGNWRHGASRDMARTEGAVCKAVVREPQEAPKPEATPAGQLLEQGWRETMESDIAAMVVLALPQVRSLSYHALGHYVVVRLLELGSREQRTAITQQLLGSVHLLCKDRFGCRVLQKAVEMVPSDMQLQLAGEIKSRVIDCVEDSYGNFVVQKFVESLPQSALDFLAEEVESQAYRLVAHEYGCRVIQRLLELGSRAQLRGILQKIVSRLPKLVRNEYGSIVVRHALQYGDEDHQRRVMRFIRTDVLKFAQCAPSSLVLEKCLEVAYAARGSTSFFEEDRVALFRAVLGHESDKNAPLRRIASDRFGNYVVQRLIVCSTGHERAELQRRLGGLQDKLRIGSGGRHVLATMQREFGSEALSA